LSRQSFVTTKLAQAATISREVLEVTTEGTLGAGPISSSKQNVEIVFGVSLVSYVTS